MNDITKEEQNEYLAYHTPDDVIKNMSKGLSVEERDIIVKSIGCTLIAGAMIGFDKGISDYLNLWYETCNDLFLLSEVTAENRRHTREKIRFPWICVPHLFAKEMVILGMDIPVTDEMVCFVDDRPFLRDAKENLEGRYNGKLGRGYACAFTYYSYHYLSEVIKLLQPSKVLLWNKFYAFHVILKGILDEYSVPVFYMEFGCVPGTFAIERQGQQGESLIATDYRKHRRQKVKNNDKELASEVVSYIFDERLNRNLQPICRLDISELRYYNDEKKTILYAGQNDYESGLYPYNEITKRYHSPYLRSTYEGLNILADLCKKNNWNLIFKPHPIMTSLGMDMLDIECVDVVEDVDINSVIDQADVVVTILSQVSYLALLRNKPVVMMGYNQLRGKRCTYEAFSRITLEHMLKKSLRRGYTANMKKQFTEHVARLLKYDLYDDMTFRKLRFGRSVDEIEV